MVIEEHRPFGSLLRRYRLAAGLTHEGLAERATLSARTISDLERGVSRGPRGQTLALLAEALRLSPEQRAALEATTRRPGGTPARSIGRRRGPGSLPIELSSFIGREREIRSLRHLLLRQDVRLITLTGTGGTGKTRLGIHVAGELGHAFPDGVFYVGLAPVGHPADVEGAIARSLGLADVAGWSSLPGLIDHLGAQDLLLVLDNFEHLLAASPLIPELLCNCPGLKVLVTSRAALRLSGEHEFPVAPLPVPVPRRLPALDELAGFPAVALFVDRAARVRPEFALGAENAAEIAGICARLDGLPLALELAAARLKILSPRALLARLERGRGAALHLLTGGARDLPARQRTLRDTIAWSYDLLDPEDQRLLYHLSVFAGGCTVEAAEAICQPRPVVVATGQGRAEEMLDRLASLADKSLLYQEDGPDGEPRFLMLETIRAFGLEQLAASREEAPLRRRHAEYYLAMVEAAGALLFADAPRRERLRSEQGNIQAALRWLVQPG